MSGGWSYGPIGGQGGCQHGNDDEKVNWTEPACRRHGYNAVRQPCLSGGVKNWNVSTLGEIDADLIGNHDRFVIGAQFRAEISSLHTDDGVFFRIEAGTATEYLHSNVVLFELIGLSIELADHDEP